MKPIIIAIVGASGSGKTLMAQYLKFYANISTVVSFTTRPKRNGEKHGVEHLFVSESKMPNKKDMLAYTKFGGYHYWATFAQVDYHNIVSYIIDEKALIRMIEDYDDRYDILPVLVKRDSKLIESQIDNERIERDKNRITIEDDGYFAIIENNGTLQEYAKEIQKLIKKIKLWQHQQLNNL